MSFFHEVNTLDKADSYFAAANTKDGFISYFKEIFSKVKKIYVIKGGPGTGKSTLMHKIAVEGKNRGFEVQKYYCSSDTSSLDGVVIGEEFAVLDGTPPHAMEPRNVGALDEIINLCDMWNADVLAENKDDICLISGKISQKYKSVYRMLNAFATLESEYLDTVNKHVNVEKLKKFTDRLADCADRSGVVNTVICDALGTFGYVRFTTLERKAKRVIYLSGRYNEDVVFLEYLKNSLDSTSASYEISLSPENSKPTAILVNDTVFVSVDTVPSGSKALNTKRFLLPTIKNEKAKLKSLEKLCLELSALITQELENIGALHDELEKFYKSAMNYDKLDRFTKKLLIKMFC